MKRWIIRFIPSYLRRNIINLRARLKYDIVVKAGANAGFNTIYEGKNLINKGARLHNCYVGFGTYISGSTNLSGVIFGKFCSIGQNVNNGFARHPSKNWVSTHPAFFSLNKQAGFTFTENQLFKQTNYLDEDTKIKNIIGNDVWIGNDVKIMPGIKIGDGAIIASGAIVTKDVENYHISGGIPAKMIRKRFSKKQIDLLLKIKWWERDIEWIKTNSHHFSDIDNFLKNFSA